MKILEIAESILMEKFRTEPFHNFRRLKETEIFSSCAGGTCSDKTRSYINTLNEKGIKANLHTALIDNKFNHQIARIEFEGHSYFADVGNGWPSIHLYPENKEVDYECYGMRFRSEIHDDTIKVYHTRNNKENLQMEFNRLPQSQRTVKENINQRFINNINYPFDRGLRFSMVVEDRFLFIRNNELQIYSDKKWSSLDIVTVDNLPDLIKEYYYFNIVSNNYTK
ncbi:MAG TPA: arylamine N-acetyltransferase [Brumimicrobium sp.]|nr:arylamine N-acetyltransferase [Brumimicrobium sp.]